MVAAVVGLALIAAACGDDDDAGSAATTAAAASATPAASAASTTAAGDEASTTTEEAADTTAAADDTEGGEPATLRLGYFPNVTHAPAILGVADGTFAKALGPNVDLELSTFNAGTDVITALFSDALDASFIGPNPAINGYAKSDGDALRIVAGTTSGGASLVVAKDINSAADLKGKTLSTPSLGNTQDVALRWWLKEQGLNTDTSGGGDVSISPQENADTLNAFSTGAIAGAWVPEPWATRLVTEGGGKVLVNEKDLWPDGQFVTTHLIVSRTYLEEHPDVIKHLIEGLGETIDQIEADPAKAQTDVNAALGELTGKPLADATIAGAFDNLSFTLDPIASSLQASADHAEAVGLLDPVDLKSPGIYDLTILNEVLKAKGDAEASGL
jgi:NitT/TauT family transport system substrate-binding protein